MATMLWVLAGVAHHLVFVAWGLAVVSLVAYWSKPPALREGESWASWAERRQDDYRRCDRRFGLGMAALLGFIAAGGVSEETPVLRAANCVYAHFRGYFWLPCPLCGRMHGGHEWGRGRFGSASVEAPPFCGRGVCWRCVDRARRINGAFQHGICLGDLDVDGDGGEETLDPSSHDPDVQDRSRPLRRRYKVEKARRSSSPSCGV